MKSLNLWSLQENQEALVNSFCYTLLEIHQNRFIELGFRSGEPVKCIKKTPFGGPRVFEVGCAVFSIAQEVGTRIFLRSMP